LNAPAAPIISVRNVVNRFGTQTVHDGVSLDVLPGEVLGIVGGSGSGKSVLLRTMLGLHKPTSGQVLVEGRNVCSANAAELLEVKRRYGVTFQHGALFSSLTVAQNIQLPMVEYFDASPETLAALTDLRLRMVGLPSDAAPKLPSQLSGGMIKRRSRSTRRCCSSTSRPPGSIRSRPRPSTSSWSTCTGASSSPS
jgi:phospholipid/cholesterol/gamma-HCH transport system ATP-binding protein